ncbi:dihydrofolate reductase family protein [Amycolatopsis magusensis]|uniref:dihydrofolate reductase family protein n=1 Tax=Amycolatopsis magusensis TaxID=882444 RepID=UPI0037AF4EF0
MGKIVNATYLTLDGDISNMQDWHMDYFGEEANRAADQQQRAADAVIMGRETYEGFAAVWPSVTEEDGSPARMNLLKKYVVSTTLTDPKWQNTEVISENVAERIRELKESGANLLQYGFGPVTRLMLDHGLLDELRVWLHPVLSGKAAPGELLYRDGQQYKFTFNGVEVHETGLLILSYTPVSTGSNALDTTNAS